MVRIGALPGKSHCGQRDQRIGLLFSQSTCHTYGALLWNGSQKGPRSLLFRGSRLAAASLAGEAAVPFQSGGARACAKTRLMGQAAFRLIGRSANQRATASGSNHRVRPIFFAGIPLTTNR